MEAFYRTLISLVVQIVAIAILTAGSVAAQSLPGLSGGYSIPSADFQKDRTVIFGYHHLNHKYYDLYSKGKDYTYSVGFVTVNFLPFAEVSVRVTYPNGFNADNEDIIIGDRMISGRLQPVREGKYHPSVVIGLQGAYKTTGGSGIFNFDGDGASFFNSSYIVMTKNFRPKKILSRIGLTAGYGSDIIAANTHQFIGLFYGLTISPQNMEFLELMIENDADKWNAGMRLTILKHIVLLAGMEGFDAFSGGISVKFQLP
jgi:hypothetical protein